MDKTAHKNKAEKLLKVNSSVLPADRKKFKAYKVIKSLSSTKRDRTNMGSLSL